MIPTPRHRNSPSTGSCIGSLGLLAALAVTLACGGGAGEARGPGARGGGRGPGAGGPTPEQEAIAVRVAPVQRAAISSLYSTSATLRADRTATVIARTRGVIQRLVVEEGDRVSEGQPLAYLENDEQRIAAERARTASETAASELARQEDLREQGLVSEDQYEKIRRDAADAEHLLELAELELSRTIIRAPFAGVILERHLDVGATVSDGTAVYDLADLNPLYADINIPERHVVELEPGQSVELTADATGETVRARIERIAPDVDPATGTVKVTVAVEGSTALRPGAFVRVDIVTDTHDDALVVPRSALVAEGRRWNLFRLGPEGDTVHQVGVGLGFENADRVEVAEVMGGETLSPGDPVVVTGAPALSEGAKVQVVDDTESPVEERSEARSGTPDAA